MEYVVTLGVVYIYVGGGVEERARFYHEIMMVGFTWVI